MSVDHGPRIIEAAEQHLDAVIEVLTEGFLDYPWTQWTVQAEGRERRVRDMYRTVISELVHPFGRVWAAIEGDGDGDVLGAAGWLAADSAPPVDVLREVEARIASLRGKRAGAASMGDRAVAEHRFDGAHWYLGALAVVPSARRRGLGRALVEPGLQAADRDQVPAALETSLPSNVGFYEGLGFRVLDHADLGPGAPPVWLMLREPLPEA